MYNTSTQYACIYYNEWNTNFPCRHCEWPRLPIERQRNTAEFNWNIFLVVGKIYHNTSTGSNWQINLKLIRTKQTKSMHVSLFVCLCVCLCVCADFPPPTMDECTYKPNQSDVVPIKIFNPIEQMRHSLFGYCTSLFGRNIFRQMCGKDTLLVIQYCLSHGRFMKPCHRRQPIPTLTRARSLTLSHTQSSRVTLKNWFSVWNAEKQLKTWICDISNHRFNSQQLGLIITKTKVNVCMNYGIPASVINGFVSSKNYAERRVGFFLTFCSFLFFVVRCLTIFYSVGGGNDVATSPSWYSFHIQ